MASLQQELQVIMGRLQQLQYGGGIYGGLSGGLSISGGARFGGDIGGYDPGYSGGGPRSGGPASRTRNTNY